MFQCRIGFNILATRFLPRFASMILPAILLTSMAGKANAQPNPAQPQQATQAAINEAIQRGVSYLRGSQNPNGGWGKGTKPGSDGGWMVGYAALVGITLIECGVSPDDPGIQAAAKGVRSYYQELDSTYELALAILFLDRMKDKSDRPRIQLLAGRLIASQTPSGGWGYKSPSKSREDIDKLFAALRKLSPQQASSGPSPRERPGYMGLCIKMSDDYTSRPEPPPFDLAKARAAAVATLPQGLKRLPIFADLASLVLDEPTKQEKDAGAPTTDNSNTHFATLGLWAARKYDVPTDRSFALLVSRFRTSQGENGSWAYNYVKNGQNGASSMTCVALLGLAIGFVLNSDPTVRGEKDAAVIKAFKNLSNVIGQPAGQINGRPAPDAVGGLYFLWGMERIAVLYDVSQLDNKDWYLWGAEILLGSQQTDGSWLKGGYPGENVIPNTCFALLFLKRANLTPDLSRRLTLDASALTATLNKPVPEPVKPPEPSRPPEPTPVVAEKEPPPKPVQPKPKTEPAPAPTAVTQTEPAPQPKSKLPWILGIGGLVVLGLGCILFAVVKRKKSEEDEDEEDEEGDRPRKKRKKKATEDEDSGKESKRGGKAKVASKRHRDEDD